MDEFDPANEKDAPNFAKDALDEIKKNAQDQMVIEK